MELGVLIYHEWTVLVIFKGISFLLTFLLLGFTSTTLKILFFFFFLNLTLVLLSQHRLLSHGVRVSRMKFNKVSFRLQSMKEKLNLTKKDRDVTARQVSDKDTVMHEHHIFVSFIYVCTLPSCFHRSAKKSLWWAIICYELFWFCSGDSIMWEAPFEGWPSEKEAALKVSSINKMSFTEQ